MKVIVIIPARYNSTRLPGKPLLDIAGKPMIQMVYEAAVRATLVDDVIIATDDGRIYNTAIGFGAKAVLTKRCHKSGMDRIAEAAMNMRAGIVINLQGDEPMVHPEAINDAIRPLLEDKTVSMTTLKKRIEAEKELTDPNIVKVVTDRDDFALYFSRLPIPYVRNDNHYKKEEAPYLEKAGRDETHYKHIGLYGYRRKFLLKLSVMPLTPLEKIEGLEQLRALENGYKIKVIETCYDTISIDTPKDLERVRVMIGGGRETIQKPANVINNV